MRNTVEGRRAAGDRASALAAELEDLVPGEVWHAGGDVTLTADQAEVVIGRLRRLAAIEEVVVDGFSADAG